MIFVVLQLYRQIYFWYVLIELWTLELCFDYEKCFKTKNRIFQELKFSKNLIYKTCLGILISKKEYMFNAEYSIIIEWCMVN